jgi:FTR1 family protein
LKGTELYESMTRKLEKKFTKNNTNTTINTPTTPDDDLQPTSSSSITAIRIQQIIPQDDQSPPKSWKALFYSYKHLQVFFWVPFLTVIREGVETVLLIGGVSFSEEPSSIPLAVIIAIILGSLISISLHKASDSLSMKWFFIVAAYVLLIMASGIFSRSVGFFEDDKWIKNIGSEENVEFPPFDPSKNIWYLPCCWENKQPFFGLLFSLFGYRAVATIGTISSYIGYWAMVIGYLVFKKKFGNNKVVEVIGNGEEGEVGDEEA